MTATVRVDAKQIDTTATRNPLLALVSTLSVATPRGERLRNLLRELKDVTEDFEMAARYHPDTTGAWLADLACEERDVWEHIVETITDPTTGESSDRG